MKTIGDIRKERERREAVARERAAALPPGDYFAAGNGLYERSKSLRSRLVLECETHTDAVMVMLVAPKA